MRALSGVQQMRCIEIGNVAQIEDHWGCHKFHQIALRGQGSLGVSCYTLIPFQSSR